jgi:hypothetical protein
MPPMPKEHFFGPCPICTTMLTGLPYDLNMTRMITKRQRGMKLGPSPSKRALGVSIPTRCATRPMEPACNYGYSDPGILCTIL